MVERGLGSSLPGKHQQHPLQCPRLINTRIDGHTCLITQRRGETMSLWPRLSAAADALPCCVSQLSCSAGSSSSSRLRPIRASVSRSLPGLFLLHPGLRPQSWLPVHDCLCHPYISEPPLSLPPPLSLHLLSISLTVSSLCPHPVAPAQASIPLSALISPIISVSPFLSLSLSFCVPLCLCLGSMPPCTSFSLPPPPKPAQAPGPRWRDITPQCL